MPFYYGPTSAVAAVYNTLVTNVQAEIDRIWTEFGDVATVPKPSTTSSTFKLRFYKHFHLSRGDYPHIMVYGTGGQMAAGSDEIDVSDWDHQVMVEWWIKGDIESTLQEQAGRLGWAICDGAAAPLRAGRGQADGRVQRAAARWAAAGDGASRRADVRANLYSIQLNRDVVALPGMAAQVGTGRGKEDRWRRIRHRR
jgi:hypothetical protein